MKRACLCTQRSESSLIAEIWCDHKKFKYSTKIKTTTDEFQTEKKTIKNYRV